jgi:hypothetical protein
VGGSRVVEELSRILQQCHSVVVTSLLFVPKPGSASGAPAGAFNTHNREQSQLCIHCFAESSSTNKMLLDPHFYRNSTLRPRE